MHDDPAPSAPTRRRFLATAAAGACAGLTLPRLAAAALPQPRACAPKSLLVLGGTGFLGPHVVEAALRGGHTVTLFNRGKTNPHLFPDLEKLHGDRNDDLAALAGRKWDWVVDTSGYVPRQVRLSAEALKECAQYVFVSTISVYTERDEPGMDEDSPVGKLDDESVEQVTGTTYGPLKALCEQAAEKALPGRVTNVRPGLIVGPGDPTDRFTYWPVRVARGGEVLAPGTAADPVQVIDVRDLAAWMVHTLEQGTVGVYNAVGPKDEMGVGTMLAACRDAASSDATFTWLPAEFLQSQRVRPWQDMPVWIPPSAGAGFGRIGNRRAVAKGLQCRPIRDTAKATLAWWREQPQARRDAKMRAGLTAEREAEVLKAWREHAARAASTRDDKGEPAPAGAGAGARAGRGDRGR